MTVSRLKELVTTCTKSENEEIAVSFWCLDDIRSHAIDLDVDLTQEESENVLAEVQSMLEQNDSFISSEVHAIIKVIKGLTNV